MGRRRRDTRRTLGQADADRRAAELAKRLGLMLKDARIARGLTQIQASRLGGLAQQTWSDLEVRSDARMTLATWNRAASAVGSTFDAFLKAATAASQPRDAVHLRHQELVVRTGLVGGWRSLSEEPIDREARTSRSADVVLQRRHDYAIVEIFDWFDDVGRSLRDFDRRLAALDAYAIARMVDEELPRSSGCWIVRATRRNRSLVNEHRHLFRARFPGSAQHGWER